MSSWNEVFCVSISFLSGSLLRLFWNGMQVVVCVWYTLGCVFVLYYLEDPGIHAIHGKYRIQVDGMEGPHFSQHFVNLTASQF